MDATAAPPPTGVSGPKPAGHPLSGHLPAFRADRLAFYSACARHGDVVPFRLALKRFVLVSHPGLIGEVLVARGHDYRKNYLLRMNRLLLGEGLLTSEGRVWRRQRRLAQPGFHHRRVASYGETMVAEAERQCSTWRDGQALDVHAELMDLTLRIAARALFGADVAPHARAVAEALRVGLERFVIRAESLLPLPERLPTPGNRALRRAVRDLDRIVYGLIGRRRGDARDHDDLLSMLLEAHDGDGDGRAADQQLRDEMVTLLLAGHETTAIALTWALHLLSRHPEVQDAVAAELAAALPAGGPTVADLPRLPYTRSVVTESMRLYPPAWALAREALVDHRLGGHEVPAGTNVVMSQWVVHRDPRWYDDPEAFRPDRWAGGLAKSLPRYAYFPFGGGPRLCIGESFALTEAVLVLATIARRFEVAPLPGHPVELWPTITLRPRHGMRLVLHERAR